MVAIASLASSTLSPRPVASRSKLSKLHSIHRTSTACSSVTSFTERAVVREAAGEVGHAAQAVLLLPVDGPAHGLGVDLGHREQDPVDVPVDGVHLVGRGDATSEVLASVGMGHGA